MSVFLGWDKQILIYQKGIQTLAISASPSKCPNTRRKLGTSLHFSSLSFSLGRFTLFMIQLLRLRGPHALTRPIPLLDVRSRLKQQLMPRSTVIRPRSLAVTQMRKNLRPLKRLNRLNRISRASLTCLKMNLRNSRSNSHRNN